MFDAIAERYDFLNHLLSAGIDRRWRRAAIRSLALTGRERVLDLCTGTGGSGDRRAHGHAAGGARHRRRLRRAMLRVGQEEAAAAAH